MTVRIERHGERRIRADVPWMGGQGSKLAKQVPGCAPMWDRGAGPDGKDKFLGWSYPLDLETCREMRRVFGDALSIGPGLLAWAREEAGAEKRMLELRSGDGDEIRPLAGVVHRAPVLAAALRPYQWRGVAFAAAGRSVLIADQPGLGKTLETLGALAEAGCKAVIVFARKSALNSVWKAEAERWLGTESTRVFVATGSHDEREKAIGEFSSFTSMFPGMTCLLVANIEMVRARKVCQGLKQGTFASLAEDQLPEKECLEKHEHPGGRKFRVVPDWPLMHMLDYDAIVVDESHRALVGPSARSKNVTQARLGMMNLKLRENGLRIALSGTPWRGKVHLMWGTLNWLRPDVFTSLWRFAEMYFAVEENEWGGKEIGELRPDRAEDFNRMIGKYMLRRTKAECAPDLPAKQYAGTPLDAHDPDSPLGVWLDMGDKQARAYKQMARDGEAELDNGTLTAAGVLAEMTRLKQLASAYMGRAGVPSLPSNKFDWVCDFLEQREGNDGKVLIFSQFTQLCEMFYSKLSEIYPGMIGMITGKTLQKVRDLRQEQFQDPDGPLRVMILNTLAGGESITLDQADDVIFLDETFIPDEQEQAEDRAHRVSRTMSREGAPPLTIYYLRSRGTIEEHICRVAGQREGSVKAVLDGSRGIEIRKQAREDR